MSSALLARLWLGRWGGCSEAVVNGSTTLAFGAVDTAPPCGDCVGVAFELFDESARRGPRRYRSGDGLTGASVAEKERSGTNVDSVIADVEKLSIVDFPVPDDNVESSFEANGCAVVE